MQIWADADHNGLLDELLFDRHDLAMGSGTRFVQRFNWDLNFSAVTPDLEPVFASGALPRYASGVTDVIDSAFDENGQLRPEFDLLGPGDLNPYMGSGGGRSDIGPYTEWTARYLAHQHARQADYLLRLGDLAGSWPIHLREPTDGHLVSLTERPNFWFDDRGEDHMRSAQWGGSPLSPDNAHVPGGLSLVPYLLTGDRYYADELALWANYAVLSTWTGNSPTDAASRSGGDAAAGFGRGILATNQVRGFAWGLRNISDAAAYLPDNDAMQTPLRRIVTENLSWLDNWAKTKTGPLKMAWLPGYGTEVDGTQRFAQLWMYEYLAWSIQHANDLGFVGGLRFRDQVVKFQTELFVNPSYNRECAAPGRLVIGQVSADGNSTRYLYVARRSARCDATLASARHVCRLLRCRSSADVADRHRLRSRWIERLSRQDASVVGFLERREETSRHVQRPARPRPVWPARSRSSVAAGGARVVGQLPQRLIGIVLLASSKATRNCRFGPFAKWAGNSPAHCWPNETRRNDANA